MSHTFLHLVETSTDLQYKIALAIHGLADNPYSPLTTQQKLPLLRDYVGAWTEFSEEKLLANRQTMIMAGGWFTPTVFGGVLVRQTEGEIGGRSVEFRQLPSRTRGMAERTWALTLPDYFLIWNASVEQKLILGRSFGPQYPR